MLLLLLLFANYIGPFSSSIGHCSSMQLANVIIYTSIVVPELPPSWVINWSTGQRVQGSADPHGSMDGRFGCWSRHSHHVIVVNSYRVKEAGGAGQIIEMERVSLNKKLFFRKWWSHHNATVDSLLNNCCPCFQLFYTYIYHHHHQHLLSFNVTSYVFPFPNYSWWKALFQN